MTHIFFLGREYLLSLAEIFAVYPTARYLAHTRTWCMVEGLTDEIIASVYPSMGGIIKVVRVDRTVGTSGITRALTDYLADNCSDNKFSFAIAYYDSERKVFSDGLAIKESLKKQGHSVRLINRENRNITSATYLHERLAQRGMEANVLWVSGTCHIGATIAYQDIEDYTRRDISRERNMQVGMLPPKLAQIMLGLAGTRGVYDPFVGLGTVLVEALHAGRTVVAGSDLSEDMVRATRDNISAYIASKPVTTSPSVTVFHGDACRVGESGESREALARCDIVTEGYLGRIFSAGGITEADVRAEITKLSRMYRDFFTSLRQSDFRGRIVITFPVWHIGGRTIHLDADQHLARDAGFRIVPL